MDRNLIIRPIAEPDLKSVLEIAIESGPGFTYLPNNLETIKAKIIESINGFSEKIESNRRFYLFVMENQQTGEIIGTTGIEACIGHPWPFYKFKLCRLTQVQQALNRYQEHAVLHLVNDHNGATELGALYLKPSYRGEGRGTFLSRSRYLFMSVFPSLFSHLVIADMRGVSNEKGISPFWDVVGSRFFGMTYAEATYYKATEGSQFLMDLLPKYPLYADFFSDDARKTMGVAHELAQPALHILEEEGFVYRNYIDIFDAGPTVEASKQELRTIRNSERIQVVSLKEKIKTERKMLVSNTEMDFRVTTGNLELTSNNEAILSTHMAKLLKVEPGSYIVYCPF